MPGAAKAAAILWIVFGGLGVLGGLASVMSSGGGGVIFQLLVALAFLITGIQVLMGKTSSILLSGIVCIVLGGLGFVAVLVLFSMLAEGGIRMPGWIRMLMVANSSLLIVAGVLAAVGNEGYKAWRVARGLAPYPVQPPACPACQGPMRFAFEVQRWVCDRCRT